jgi:hypothetical protein
MSPVISRISICSRYIYTVYMDYMEKDLTITQLDTSKVGQDIIRFETVSSTSSATPTATSSSSSPLDLLNPLSTASPLNPENPDNPLNKLKDDLEPIIDGLTDSLNDGLGNAINQVVDGLVKEAGLKGVYTLYLNRLCERKEGDGAGGAVVEQCLSYADAVAGTYPFFGTRLTMRLSLTLAQRYKGQSRKFNPHLSLAGLRYLSRSSLSYRDQAVLYSASSIRSAVPSSPSLLYPQLAPVSPFCSPFLP